MGQSNSVPRRINGVEGAPGQNIKSGGPGNSEYWGFDDYGLSFEGTVTGVAGAPNFQCTALTGFGNDYFEGYWVYVVWDAGGGGGAPQGERQICTAYNSATGDFTVAAFSVAIAVGDKVLIMHPSLVASLDTSERALYCMDFWSDPSEEEQLGAAAATIALPDVTVADLPSGATVVRAIAMFKFRMIENTNAGANKLNGATVASTSQVIQVRDDTPGTWRDAINFADDMFGLAATTRESGDAQIGSIDIAVEVDGNDTYNFQWLLSRADLDNLNFNDCQTGLRVLYSV